MGRHKEVDRMPTSFCRSWGDMKSRCTNKKVKNYKNYGGRGITICERWLKYKNFREDMIDTYRNGLTLDRIDNNGNYCKENCRWATRKEQAQHTRNTERACRIEYNGELYRISELANIFNIKRTTLIMRLNKYNMSLEKALRAEVNEYHI